MKRNLVVSGDCVEALRSLPDGVASLVIADPPYNIGPAFGIDKEWNRSTEWLPWCESWLKECLRVLTPSGQIFIYGIHHYQCYLQCLLYDLGLKYRRQIIWHYENGWSRSKKTLATHYEPILWFSKSDTYTYHPVREPYKSTERLKNKIIKNGKVWVPNPEGRMAGDVWKFPTLAGKRFEQERVDHPTQKPLALTDRIIRHFSNEGELVVVPFAGSGTECVSAARNRRAYWGCELKQEYVELALSRLASPEARRELPFQDR
ncbi:DNA-methyltransferase [Mycobacterium asiaticum]|uniref:DNA-methyltransferase n=1 Tax=Mycobacterium asiaticum TaxID=1790 RepID=UPI0009BDBD62|nr:site-specific DNA-methyltransferase [Mycobacterium asiaticum]